MSNDWQDDIDWWADSLSLAQYSSHTIGAYVQAVQALARFLQAQGLLSWQACQRQELSRYFAMRQDEGLSVRSAKRHVSAVVRFFEFLVAQGVLSQNPATSLRLSGKSDRLPTLLDVDVLFRLLDQPVPADDKQALLWQRDKAMFELLYGSGLRVSEVVGLDVVDVDFGMRQVLVLGKGKKHRQVPMTKRSVQAIGAYLPVRERWQKGDGAALFLSRLGTRLTTRAVQKRLEIAAIRAGIAEHLHPHLLRHAFASHLLSSSGDLRAVQELLGHESLAATQVYTHLDFQKLASLYDKTHPRA